MPDPFLEQMRSRLLAHAGALDEVRSLLRGHTWAQLEIGCAVADLHEAARQLAREGRPVEEGAPC